MSLESFFAEFAGLFKLLLTAGAVWFGFVLLLVLIIFGVVFYQMFVAGPRDRKRIRSDYKKGVTEMDKEWRGR